ncbi:divalent-cation tolerance protein CutA [Phormidesmis priestleyi ULC007]|uniref:Divalent-cation tolerance protein CutA n=1 Tax=Phormidesmis priestleyi ULC007 TaxID=1920490 RepID=A0A2T1DEQ6_9CYAN|nr:divalent-cation tolerance protein CutA [Phormidesmis priestleyi]PSB18955.1 divalent-cation tolerance protein CutA [Phormidesmis priestleyi ULC007]PZO53943.1 MAG: divalent-cation tolerance protein CutA [Phormidesmis priestleyi]
MTEETGRYGIMLVTASSRQEADAIAESLIQAKLAACVNLLPVFSIYTWQGTVHHDEEWQLLIKSERSRFDELEAKIREIHSYEVPEIIMLPIVAGSQPYLQWISSQVQE